MSEELPGRTGATRPLAGPYGQQGSSANLADILELVLDRGVVIAGDIRINLLDIELLTIKIRLLVASVDKAKEMGIDWWEHDPSLSSQARSDTRAVPPETSSTPELREARGPDGGDALAEENARLKAELAQLRAAESSTGAEAETGRCPR